MAIGPTTLAASELAPTLSAKAPTHLGHILANLDEGIRMDAPATALRATKEAFAFLLGHFADLVAANAVELGANRELFLRDEADLVSLTECENRLREGLHFLATRENDPLSAEIVQVFFDSSGSPKSFYLLAQGGKVEGKATGLQRLSEFCKTSRRQPSRAESFKLRNLYMPHLLAWLNAATRLWESGEKLWERTSLKGRQRIRYRLAGRELIAGLRCDLQNCPACIPSRVVVVGSESMGNAFELGVPQNVPEHTLHLVDRWSASSADKDIISSCALMRDTLEFLLRYFAGVAKTAIEDIAELPPEAASLARDTSSVDNCERLLQVCIEALKQHQDDSTARELVGAFYRRNLNLELEPRPHTHVLLLEGVLSSWFKHERGLSPSEDRSRRDFERYFPLFRDWLQSTAPYFSRAEHLEEAPSREGILPLSVRLGDRLLDLIAPQYELKIRQCPVCLPNPAWMDQASAAPKAVRKEEAAESLPEKPAVPEMPADVPGEFRPLHLPGDSPKYLGRILKRLDIRLRRGELVQIDTALRDSLEYLLRYWAGVAAAAARHMKLLSPEAEALAKGELPVQDCEKLLILTLASLRNQGSDLAEEILRVFYRYDVITDEYKPNGSHSRMLTMDASSDNKMQILADFCGSPDEIHPARSRGYIKTFLPILRDWLDNSQIFFEQCEHHEEEPDKQFRMELVVQFDEEFLELVAPEYTFFVRPGADLVPELDVPEWVEPVEEKVVKEEAPKPKFVSAEDLHMQEPFLMHRVAYVAVQKNSKGSPCLSGIIKISNAGGGTLTGRAYATHPCLEISPVRFKDKSQLTYWLDEKTIPKDFIPTIVLRSGGDERQITIPELRPLGAFNTIPKAQAMVLLALPTAIPFLIFFLLLFVVGGDVARLMAEHPNDPDALDVALGKGQLIGWPFLLLAAFCPVGTYQLFKRYPPSLQDLADRLFLQTLFAPSFIMLPLVGLLALIHNVASRADLRTMNLSRLFPYFILFNLASAAFVYVTHSRKLNEWIPEKLFRPLVPLGLLAIFIMISTMALM